TLPHIHDRSRFKPQYPPPHHHSFPTRRSSDLPELHSMAEYEGVSEKSNMLGYSPKSAGCKAHERRTPWWNASECNAECGAHAPRSEEHTSELQSRFDLVCRLLLEKKNITLSIM